MATLCIADPPYPPSVAMRYDVPGGRVVSRSRARRYYGDGTRCATERPADFHPAAGEWDNPARHSALLQQLLRDFDGWAIATTPDGVAAYGPLPVGARLMAWVQPNNPPNGGRIRRTWEEVITYTPPERIVAGPRMADVLVCATPRIGFPGAKPAAWTHWVLDALGYEPATDELVDLFPGSGSVAAAAATWTQKLVDA